MSSERDQNFTDNSKKPEQTYSPNANYLQLRSKEKMQNGLAAKGQSDHSNPAGDDMPDVKVSEIIGNFGPYQIAIVIFSALRALSCALDGLSGSFLSPNIKHFECTSCESTPLMLKFANSTGICSGSSNITSDQIRHYNLDSSQCFFYNSDPTRTDRISCDRWSFEFPENDRFMHSLTVEQSLVCDREWLRSLSNSFYFVGATLGLLFWGIVSDRYGRKTAYVYSHLVTMTFGFGALFANSMSTFILLRAINAFGMIGELIPRSITIETVATEYRFICSVVCQIGWAIGIILVPALSYINPSYRFILSVPVGLSFMMLPWLFYLPESARWLIANQQYSKAKNELIRAAKINGKLTSDIEHKIDSYNHQVLREEASSSNGRKRLGFMRSIFAIFTNASLLKDTLSVFTLLFIAEVVYFSLMLNVADLSGSLYVNYIISGLSELVSIAFCGTLLAYLSRRMCLSLLLLASTLAYLLLALVNIYEDHLSMTIILTVNAFGKLTAIGNLMIIILVSQEIFPTVIRQFGTSLCITIGKSGSVLAPFTHELGQIIGQSWCFALFSLLCLSCAIIPFIMSETGNKELADTVVEVENGPLKRNKGPTRSGGGQSKQVAHYESNGPTVNLNHDHDPNNNIAIHVATPTHTPSGKIPLASRDTTHEWPEFLALAAKNNCKFNLISCKDHLMSRPFILIELRENTEEESLIKSVRESYLLRDLYELWASSKVSVEDLAIQASRSSHFERCRALHSSEPRQSFKIKCESFGCKISQSAKIDMIDKMFFVTAFEPAPLDLSNPNHTYCIFQLNVNPGNGDVGEQGSREFYFGRHLAKSSRALVDQFTLKKRSFIANTSMDPLLSLIAANAAQVKANDFVFDPFVGSGSLLVAAASLGAHVLGADIDWQLLHGKSKPSRKGMTKRQEGECVRANLRQYNLESKYIDVMISDISRHGLRSDFEFDAIIADPPYGIRESSERIGSKQRDRSSTSEDKRPRFPSKIIYHTADLITDLLGLAVSHLRLGGRLIYYLPVTVENANYKFEDFLPSHSSLELIAFCDQQLTKTTYRLMVVMEKKRDSQVSRDKINVPEALLTMDFRGTYFKETKSRND